jgi:hypothetical protein
MMHPTISRFPKWARWFSLGIILALVGGIFLLISFLKAPTSPASQQNATSESLTISALTLASEQALITPTPPVVPTSPMSPTPSSTNFPVLSFTLPASQNPTAGFSGSAGCNNAIYISDVTIPDGTVLAPGAKFVKTWMLENTGTCTWSTNYQLIFITGDQMGGTATSLSNTVAPSQQGQVSVSLTAPSVEGSYKGYWQLADGQGNPFGGQVTVVIVVSTATATPTYTPTATGAKTPTYTRSATVSNPPSLTPSETVAPSSIPTATSTASATNLPVPTPTPTDTPST